MSLEPISRREDLERLKEAGYDLEIRSGYLVLHRVPYVTSERVVKYGMLVCAFADTGPPPDHTMYFAGEYPCDHQGSPIEALRNSSERQELAKGVWIDHYFSAKPNSGAYEDYYQKLTHYATVIGRCAKRLDPNATSRSGKLALSIDSSDPFVFMESASSRAGITRLNERLSHDKIGIIGLGGTGSYILDYLCKTHVAEIHLFDGDRFEQHNAFRSPGPTLIEELEQGLTKVQLYKDRYEKLRNGIFAHEFSITPDHIESLASLDFVFVAVDNNETRGWLLPKLSELDVAFIDVGMGLERVDDQLLGIVRTTFGEMVDSSAVQRDGNSSGNLGEYERNVQIVELNALNAALAVIRWKKYRGFYLDLRQETRSNYTIDGNHISNN